MSIISKKTICLVIQKLNPSYFCICLEIFEENPLQNSLCWCLGPNLEKDSFFILMKSSKISSKSDTISQSGVDFEQIKNKFLEALGVTVLKTKKYSLFLFAFSVFYECNAAWTAKSTKSKSLIYVCKTEDKYNPLVYKFVFQILNYI